MRPLASLGWVRDQVARGEKLTEDVPRFTPIQRLPWEAGVRGPRGGDVSDVWPVIEVAGGVDCAVVAEVEQGARVDFEMEVR